MSKPTNTISPASAADISAAGTTSGTPSGAGPASGTTPTLIEEELLVEEISIDGMCGVY
jgi:mycofactocin precursor